MAEQDAAQQLDLADELLEVLPNLLQRLRADVPLDADPQSLEPEWRDIAELRATRGQFRLLGILVRQERCTMQDLAEQLAVTPPTATAMVKRLFAQGYIERLRDEQDWRVVWVRPTERGKKAITLYNQVRRAALQKRLGQLNDEELERLRAVLPVLKHLSEVRL
ncbi:MarR family transcriptional regulator [Ktedonosporobacter rubrisoli]|nr:MarR family transcriptional regulator [Ktedonosporobacter rubrisoli]